MIKQKIISLVLKAGFIRARILFPFEKNNSLVLCALPLGKDEPSAIPKGFAEIALFARNNYYREAVRRLQNIAAALRAEYGGEKADWRIYCNSRLNEKQLAAQSGLGVIGKHSLLITPEAGTYVILAAMTIPYILETDTPLDGDTYHFCAACPSAYPRCAAACPAQADGRFIRERCIQWYASGHGSQVPEDVRKNWGHRFYGCEECQRYCPHNQITVQGAETQLGKLERFIDIKTFLTLSDDAINCQFKKTVLGQSWLGPAALRRNALLCGQ